MRIACILAVCVAAVAAKNSYVIVSPTQVRPGKDLHLSVNILEATGDVRVQAQLVHQSNKQVTASASGDFIKGTPKTLTLSVPHNLPSGGYNLQVHGTRGLTFSTHKSISYKNKNMSIFIQTDKAMYKPGQTVNFRTFAADSELKMYTGTFTIEIIDPNSNKIKQWLGVSDPSGVIVDLLRLSDQPVLGDWKIKVHAGHQSQEKSFTIAEYVLPKFEVTVELPSYVLNTENSIKATVRAKYTYGKPVHGSVKLTTKYSYSVHSLHFTGHEPSVEQTLHLNDDGTAVANVPLTALKNLHTNVNGKTVIVVANVTEDLTGITLSGNSTVKFHQYAYKMSFLKSNPKNFKPGLPFTAYLKVSQVDDRPIVGTRQGVSIDTMVTYELPHKGTTSIWYSPQTKNYHLPVDHYQVADSGIIPVEVHIPDNATSITVNAKYGTTNVKAHLTLSKMHSPSNSYIQTTLKSTGRLAPGSRLTVGVEATQPMTSLIYQILARGSIVQAGEIAVSGSKRKEFSEVVTSQMAPNARLVCYYVRQDGEIVADSISFDVEGAFENKVSISFDKTKAQPGENVNVHVTADPHSSVNLLAVDQSVLLLKSGNDITQSDVITELKSYDTITHHSTHHFGPIFGGPVINKAKRMIWWYPYPVYYGGSDATEIFNNAGVMVLTDATLYHYVDHHILMPSFGGHHHGIFFNTIDKGLVDMVNKPLVPMVPHETLEPELKEVEKIRNAFPETWLWTRTNVSSSGRTTITTQIPDTITSWVASAFAANPTTGLGVSPTTAKIEAFRSFFVSLNLPYSVVRGEQVAIQANVFNYLPQDVDVVVTLLKNTEFQNVMVDVHGNPEYRSVEQTQRVHIKHGEAKSVFFPIVPDALGKVDVTVKAQTTVAADAVKRQLLVEAEGVEKEYNTPVLVDLKQRSHFTKQVPITLPSGVIADSSRVRITAIGDLMGPSVNNLDSLLKMPYGCGEQNMLNFAPDIFVTKYLSITGQLTPELEAKATKVMEHGYQKEMTYQHKDGSFSAFGDRDKSGSMWLTAFVAKSFHRAKPYIFIDDNAIVRAINWMVAKQAHDGSFPEPGRIIHKNMQGGSASGPALTAFVLIALLENNDLGSNVQNKIHLAANKAKSYLETTIHDLTDDYSLAITSYALYLAKSNMASSVFARLNSDAVVQAGLKHWHQTQEVNAHAHRWWTPPHVQAHAVDIEMTAYALLVYAGKKDISDGLSIMKWITQQRNPRGGFSSTQDTVLALQALADFAGMIYSNNFNMDIHVSAGSFSHHFNVNQKNALVLQMVDLPAIPTSLTVSSTGHGMGLVDVAVYYNVEAEIEEPSFDLTVELTEETINKLVVKTCTRWLKSGTSGMAVQEIGVPTGFEADQESIPQLGMLKRIEPANRKLILYFDEISTHQSCFSVDMIRTGLVAKSQPAPVRVYDYYEPKNQVTAFFQSQVLKDSSICDVCVDCGCKAHAGK